MPNSSKPTLDFYDKLREKARIACKKNHRFHFSIAGKSACAHFSDAKFKKIFSNSLSHLETDEISKPTINLFAFDSDVSEIELPQRPWAEDTYGQHGLVEEFTDDRIKTIFHIGPNTLNMVDLERSEGIYWLRSSNSIPYYEEASPFRTILYYLLEPFGLHLFHAAAIANKDSALLLVGKSGSGKSTTSLATLESDLLFVSDDYCVVQVKDRPRVYSLYSAAKSTWDTLERLPFLKNFRSKHNSNDDEKAVYQINEFAPKKIGLSAEVKGIVIPRITNSKESQVSKIPQAKVLLATAPSTLFQLPRGKESNLNSLASVVAKVPGYQLAMSEDSREITEKLKSLIIC